MAWEWFNPIEFASIEDIGRNFWKNAVLWYIRDLQDTLLDRNHLDNLSSWLSDQLVDFVKNPDKWSDFEEKLKDIPQDLSSEDLIKWLFMMWYGINAKILPENDKIVSFIAYQEDTNNNILKIFKLYTDEKYTWWRLTYDLTKSLLEQTDKNIQVGKWPDETDEVNEKAKATIRIFKENGYQVDEGRFIIQNNNI